MALFAVEGAVLIVLLLTASKRRRFRPGRSSAPVACARFSSLTKLDNPDFAMKRLSASKRLSVPALYCLRFRSTGREKCPRCWMSSAERVCLHSADSQEVPVLLRKMILRQFHYNVVITRPLTSRLRLMTVS